ncbi:oxygenase MpaB family protein [Arthrobacter agilis]|uniref:oxygenase MpaB family protein n=1 Tax=Arthrobacter agilis TaxID=37921 RepID=UPI002365BD65|nr:oxygenase MpaB family protein [Arthrobacter agilis]WDF33677.1 oxygenase MpaB family protein [Arthrobacter agilis]
MRVRWTDDGPEASEAAVGSAVWTVHSSMTPTVAGIRALLLQTLHPGAMAGVHAHSSFREEPLGRLANTIRWIFTVTYGSKVAAQEGSAFVQRLHTRVNGTYVDSRGTERPYSAADPDLIRWVHLAFTDAFVAAHAAYGGPIPGGVDEYVSEWAAAGELMGLEDPPRSEAELQAQLAAFDAELATSAQVQEAITYIRRPPLPRSQRIGYQILFAGAVATLEPRHRELLGLRVPSLGPIPLPIRTAVRLVLGMIRLGLGAEGPAETAAKIRIRRLGGTPPA